MWCASGVLTKCRFSSCAYSVGPLCIGHCSRLIRSTMSHSSRHSISLRGWENPWFNRSLPLPLPLPLPLALSFSCPVVRLISPSSRLESSGVLLKQTRLSKLCRDFPPSQPNPTCVIAVSFRWHLPPDEPKASGCQANHFSPLWGCFQTTQIRTVIVVTEGHICLPTHCRF